MLAWKITTSQDTALFRIFSTFTILKHSDSYFGVYLSLSNYKAITPLLYSSLLGIEAFFQEAQEVSKMSRYLRKQKLVRFSKVPPQHYRSKQLLKEETDELGKESAD